MKRLTCEMCGSTDLIKQDGVFVCQSCGTKYSVEEARKIMIEGTVDVTGSRISIDTSERLEKILVLARRARIEDNIVEAKKYYELALIEAPDDWEANFYSSYYKLLESPVGKLSESLSNFANRAKTSLQIILSSSEDNAAPEKIADLFESTAKIYLIIAGHVENRRQELINAVINDAMSGLLKTLSNGPTENAYLKYQEGEMKERKAQDEKNERNKLYHIMGTMRTSILDAYKSLEYHSVIALNIAALQNLLRVCSTLYCLDAKRVVDMENYEQFTYDLLAFESMMIRQTPNYDGQAHKMLKAQAISIESANKGQSSSSKVGRRILELIEQEERAISQKKVQEYWAEHQDECETLKAELHQLQSEEGHLNTQFAELEREKRTLPAVSELAAIREQISSLTQQKNSLGFFKGKEKKVLQDRIAVAEQQAEETNRVLKDQQRSIDEKISPVATRLSDVQSRISAINERLENPIGIAVVSDAVSSPIHVTRQVTAALPGTILDIKVAQSTFVKAGDVLMVQKALGVKSEILSPQDGTVISVNTFKGAEVGTGTLLCILQ